MSSLSVKAARKLLNESAQLKREFAVAFEGERYGQFGTCAHGCKYFVVKDATMCHLLCTPCYGAKDVVCTADQCKTHSEQTAAALRLMGDARSRPIPLS